MWPLLIFLLQSFLLYRLFKFLYYAWKPLYLYGVLPRMGWGPTLEEYKDEWAVVTGCTDGIGNAIVR